MFQKKVALITGGGSGIGRATVLEFVKEGAKVFIVDINEENGKETMVKVKDLGGEGFFYKADVSEESQIEKAILKCIEIYGRIDYCHNNAGIVICSNTVDCTVEIWDKVINTNLKGVWLCMKHEIKQMLLQGHGAIVNTSSISGLIGRTGDMPYSVSKFGIVGLTKTAALEYADKNIRINCVCPAAIHTPWVKKVTKGLCKLHPMNRIGEPKEVADSVIWLCSDKSSFITGHALIVDGGRIAGEW